jgi:hypothetical protein
MLVQKGNILKWSESLTILTCIFFLQKITVMSTSTLNHLRRILDFAPNPLQFRMHNLYGNGHMAECTHLHVIDIFYSPIYLQFT